MILCAGLATSIEIPKIIGTVLEATLGKLRDGVERIWAFPSA